MSKKCHIIRLMIVCCFIVSMHAAFGSFCLKGVTDGKSKNNKYSLKSMNLYTNKTFSLSLLKSTLQLKGLLVLNQKTTLSDVEVNSMVQYNRGNTSYVLPYKLKVKMPLPKFKTPSPVNQ